MSKFAIYGPTSTTAAFEPRTARAYCEGRQAAHVAVTTNPYTIEVEAENFQAWAAGNADYATIPASATHCAGESGTAVVPVATVPDIVGMTQVNADAAIVAASMTVGTKTNTLDPVTAQALVAGTEVAIGTALDYTLTL